MEARETPSGPAHFRQQPVNPIFGLAWNARRTRAPLLRPLSEPNDTVMGIPPSPKRPRDPAQGNMQHGKPKSHPECLSQQSAICLRAAPVFAPARLVLFSRFPPGGRFFF
eukprot:scaffold2456_cov129-Isochrysis_galbana.AAC.5